MLERFVTNHRCFFRCRQHETDHALLVFGALIGIAVISDHNTEQQMLTIDLKDAKAGLSHLVDKAIRGEFVTITRHGKPVAALVSLEAAEIAHRTIRRERASFVSYLRSFPGGEFERNHARSRDIEL